MIPLDHKTWERTELVEKYAPYAFPYINLGADLDVTGLYRFAKENDLSFYCAMIHTVCRVASEFRNFHYRLVDGEPMLCGTARGIQKAEGGRIRPRVHGPRRAGVKLRGN